MIVEVKTVERKVTDYRVQLDLSEEEAHVYMQGLRHLALTGEGDTKSIASEHAQEIQRALTLAHSNPWKQEDLVPRPTR
jgi:hypothetical protein